MLFLGKVIFGDEIIHVNKSSLPLQLKIKKSQLRLMVKKKGIAVNLSIPNYDIIIDKK